ncbi:MAG TPA: 16S rRNA (cytosine(1402)-N(4))-methyltransferase RsmH [Candidatus Udaeobacter sp.]|nr:16S rRNA (cytosine(1402)-N(4))-methyltransferase RsmH [Candidatus Udaeobacter sp.]
MPADTVHRPVMVAEVLQALVTDRRGRYADLTVGGGGHAEAILDATEGTLIGLDRDPQAVARVSARLRRFGERAIIAQGRGGDLPQVLTALGIDAVDGVLVDLGLSSDQLAAGRGFSFEDAAAPLDLRFDAGEARPTAADLLADSAPAELARLWREHGDFPPAHARGIARAIATARARAPITRVAELNAAVAPLFPPHQRAQNLARIYQALRIEVNDELGELDRTLAGATAALRVGGVLCVLAYHSLEDRRVKSLFALRVPPRREVPAPPGWSAGPFQPLFRRGLRPQAAEVLDNPRARSARLRAGVRTEDR